MAWRGGFGGNIYTFKFTVARRTSKVASSTSSKREKKKKKKKCGESSHGNSFYDGVHSHAAPKALSIQSSEALYVRMKLLLSDSFC